MKTAIDNRMFGRQWYQQHAVARHASIDAASAGLRVRVEETARYPNEALITWRGTPAQFAATRTFPDGAVVKSRYGRRVCPFQLRGYLYPCDDGKILFVIEYVFLSAAHRKRMAAAAQVDGKYLDFRDKVMSGFPLPEIEVRHD